MVDLTKHGFFEVQHTPNPKPQTLNPKPQTPNIPKPYKPSTPNPKTGGPEPKFNPELPEDRWEKRAVGRPRGLGRKAACNFFRGFLGSRRLGV